MLRITHFFPRTGYIPCRIIPWLVHLRFPSENNFSPFDSKRKSTKSFKNMQKHFHKCIVASCINSPNIFITHQNLASQSCFKLMLVLVKFLICSKTDISLFTHKRSGRREENGCYFYL